MAFTDTTIIKAVVKAAQGKWLQDNQSRRESVGILEMAWMNREALLGLSQIAALTGKGRNRDKSIYVFRDKAPSASNDRACAGVDPLSTAKIDITYATVAENFSVSEMEMNENEYAYDEALAHGMATAFKNISEKLDAVGYTYLNANDTSGTAISPYVPVAGVIDIPRADWDVQVAGNIPIFLNKLRSQMRKDRYSGLLNMIGDPMVEGVVATLMSQGQANSSNLNFQFLGWDTSFSNNIVTADYGSGFIMPANHLGLITHALMWEKTTGADVWTSVEHPNHPGLWLDVKIQRGCVDNSGTIPGGQADLVTSVVLSVDYSYFSAGTGLTDTGIRRIDLQTV